MTTSRSFAFFLTAISVIGIGFAVMVAFAHRLPRHIAAATARAISRPMAEEGERPMRLAEHVQTVAKEFWETPWRLAIPPIALATLIWVAHC